MDITATALFAFVLFVAFAALTVIFVFALELAGVLFFGVLYMLGRMLSAGILQILNTTEIIALGFQNQNWYANSLYKWWVKWLSKPFLLLGKLLTKLCVKSISRFNRK